MPSLVLYMIYFPPHLKYTEVDVDLHNNRPPRRVKVSVKSDAWRLSIILSWAVLIHMYAPSILPLITRNTVIDPARAQIGHHFRVVFASCYQPR